MARYEWDIETVDKVSKSNVSEYRKVHPEMKIGEAGDVLDHDHADKLSEFDLADLKEVAGIVPPMQSEADEN